MSRLFEALRQSENESRVAGTIALPESPEELIQTFCTDPVELEGRTVDAKPSSNGHLVSLTHEFGLAAEKFRVLATRLEHLRSLKPLKTLHIASSVGEEGKTLVAANLGIALAKSSQRVLLVEGDLRKPQLTQLLGVPAEPGLCDWHREPDAELSRFVLRLRGLNVWLLTAGNPPRDAREILHSSRLREAVSQLALSFDWVIIDSPPLVPVADAHVWARMADGTLLVVREGKTPRKVLTQALESLDNPRLVGVILNDASDSGGIHYEHYSLDSERVEAMPVVQAKGSGV